jgi:hypothetical protein
MTLIGLPGKSPSTTRSESELLRGTGVETGTSQPGRKAHKQGRICIWQQWDAVHCSIIGTCLTTSDLLGIARRLRLEFAERTTEYDVHGYFVQNSTTDGPIARAVQKLLDDRYAGALRRFARLNTAEEMAQFWDDNWQRGEIAAAYWALMSSSAVPEELRGHAFGEVHMLSHLCGAHVRQQAGEFAALKAQMREQERRWNRLEAQLRNDIAERDGKIEEFDRSFRDSLARGESRPARGQNHAASAQETRSIRRAGKLLVKTERALVAARFRARTAEEQVSALERENAALRSSLAAAPANSPGSGDGRIETVTPTLDGKVILYLGGRSGSIEQLRGVASDHNVCLLHHDGGLEEAPARIDSLVSGADCVLCPVDCVSHLACQRAKTLCRKQGKTFVPLRTAGVSTFARALRELAL